jgi:uncharacterized cupin superfamily protein
MSESILSSTLVDVKLEPGSIPSAWLLGGQPETRSKVLGKSRDALAYVMLWECGAVSYRWHYSQDEAYIVLSGEGFMTDDNGVERRFGPGDVAFFPAGTNATWRHPDHFRKVAVLKESFGRPLGLCLKAWSKVLGMLGLSGKSAFMFLVAVCSTSALRWK